MSPDTIDLLILLIGAVLALVGYLAVDLGRPRETALGSAVDRELSAAVIAPPAIQSEKLILPGWPAADMSAYTYREVPPPTPDAVELPRWLVRILRLTDTCHTLDADDCLVAFVRVRNPLQLIQSPLSWSCRALPSERGVVLVLCFQWTGGAHEVPIVFRFANSRDLRHAHCLAQQGVLRIDFLTRTRFRRLRHAGSRLAPVPDRILDQLARLLRDGGEEDSA